jgi:hypothetical protein
MSLMARNRLDGEPLVRQLLGVKQPRPWLDRAAVIDSCRTSKFASAVSGYDPEETALCKISPL